MREWKPTNTTSQVKKTIIKQGLLPFECAICKLKEWLGKPLTLHLDHINGNNKEHKLSNLRFLCPNCHSQTDTYCGRNNSHNYSSKNKKVSDDDLLQALKLCRTVSQALKMVGLSGATNYQRVYRLCETHKITHITSNNVKFEQRKNLLLNSNIDFTKHGALVEAAQLVNVSPQALGRWIKKHIPEILVDNTL